MKKGGNYMQFDLLKIKKAYKEDKNITKLLREQKKIENNTSEIIEVAYDLQSGSYIDFVKSNPKQSKLYSDELSYILNNHLDQNDSLLDIGTGELTTLSLITSKLDPLPSKIYAFDISWSRLFKGIEFSKEILGNNFNKIFPFSAKISEIPLMSNSIDITTSSHALEPNGGNLSNLLKELFRVTKKKLVLFEPYYEGNSKEGKKRMDSLGYIKNLEEEVINLGGELIENIKIRNSENLLNPTYCFVIKPPLSKEPKLLPDGNIFSEPGTNNKLERLGDFYFSNNSGLSYPIIKSIPILKSSNVILTSALCKNNVK